MSDDEPTKKSGYRLEYAPSNRSKCTGPKPCKGTIITKGDVRVGSVVDFQGNTSFAWRHWGCVTPKILDNMKKAFEEVEELDGFDDLQESDQDRVRKAWEDGHVADEDIPESARKPIHDEDEKPKKKAAKGKKAADDGEPKKSKFKLEYASSGRAKCKDCSDAIGKAFFRLGNEVPFRGNTSTVWRHWGCTNAALFASLKVSYEEPTEIEGFSDLKVEEQDKVRRAWEEGAIPADDQGPGEAAEIEKKKAPARRKKAETNGEDKPKRSRAKKAKKDDDDDEEEEEEEEEEEKPKKKRAPAKKAAEKAPPKKRASKKKADSEDSAEDFGDEIAAVVDDDEEEEQEAEEEEKPKKRKRAPDSKATKPPSKRAKPSSSRNKKKAVVEESEED